MQHVRYTMWVVVTVASLCRIAPATHQGGHMAWATAKGTLRVAVVGCDRESTAPWEGSTPMLPYIGKQLVAHRGKRMACADASMFARPPGWRNQATGRGNRRVVHVQP